MGANVVLYAAQRLSSLDGYVGTILFGAAVGVDPRGVPPAVVVGALRVASFFMPEASLGATPVEEPDGYALPADSTRNFRGHWPLVTGEGLLDATRDALADAKASKRGLDAARFLVVHGAQDHVVPLSCARRFSQLRVYHRERAGRQEGRPRPHRRPGRRRRGVRRRAGLAEYK